MAVARWLDDRLGTRALYQKYGRKAFPVHSTFFLGEIALFSFVILVLTGIYLGLIYTPSNVEIPLGGANPGTNPGGAETVRVPEAYASVLLIESIPVANLFRNVHHWAAHVMVASIILHQLRIFLTGTYRKPRELNWVVGVVLLGLSLVAGFVGYALPYDAYAVTATGIGYGIARSIPWVGQIAAELFFGGAFPTLGSLPRLYTIHVVILPALITGLIALHLLIVIKQKHSQPGYARRLAEPGRVLGVPMWPYQALLAGQLFLLLFGGLFLLSAYVPVHPLEAYGPPGPFTPEVKPDWYLLWVYGFLLMVPHEIALNVPGATIGPEFIGGILFPGLIFALITFAPWLDMTNHAPVRRFEYMEPPRQGPIRVAMSAGLFTLIALLCVAAYAGELQLELIQYWFVLLTFVPLSMGLSYAAARWVARARGERFDPTAEDVPPEAVDRSPYGTPSASPAPESAPAGTTETAQPTPTSPSSFADWFADQLAGRRDVTAMEVAAEVGVLDGDVQDWLVGRRVPSRDECRRVAAYLGVPDDEVHSRCGMRATGAG